MSRYQLKDKIPIKTWDFPFVNREIILVKSLLQKEEDSLSKLLKGLNPFISDEFTVYYKEFYHKNIVVLCRNHVVYNILKEVL